MASCSPSAFGVSAVCCAPAPTPAPERINPETLIDEARLLTRMGSSVLELAVRIHRKTIGELPPEPPLKNCRTGITGRLDEVENSLTMLGILLNHLEDVL